MFKRLSEWAGWASNWAGLFTLLGGGALLSALLGWAASMWGALAAQGLGAIIFAGIGGACLVLLTLSAAAVAYRQVRPLAPSWPEVPSLDFTPAERVEGLESLRDMVGAVAASLREQEDVPGKVKSLVVTVEAMSGEIEIEAS